MKIRLLSVFLLIVGGIQSAAASTNPILGNKGVIPSNSSSIALDNGEAFTGKWVDVSNFAKVAVAVKTDQNGTFSIQYSPDCENQDSTLTRYYRTTQIEAPHVFVNARKCVRVVFTNDSGTNQTYLRLQVMAGDFGELNAPSDSIVAQDFDATVMRPTDFHTEVALGRRQGVTTWNKFGYNTDIDTASGDEILASWGGTFQFITTGETITIVSSSTADADGDTGVNSIVVYGVDENWDAVTEVFLMNGTTNVVSTSSWIGINRVAVFLSGTGRTNAGTISVTASSSGYTLAQMPVGTGVTQQCVFYVARNHQYLAEWLHFTALKIGGGNPSLEFKGQVYSSVNNTIQEIYRGELDTNDSTNLDVNTPIPFPVSESAILYFTGSTTANNTSVTCRFSGELFRDPDG